jgi:hypothetical protein
MRLFLYAQEITNPLRVFGYQVAEERLAPLPGSPWTTGGLATCNELCQAIAYSGRQRLLFAGGDAGIVVFRVAADGTLERVPGRSPDPGPVYGLAVAEDAAGSWVYATDSLHGEIRGYLARPDGRLAPVTDRPAAFACQPLDACTAGDDLFVATWDGSAVAAYRVERGGLLREWPGSPFATSLPAVRVSASLDGRFLYTTAGTGPTCQRFRIDPTRAALHGDGCRLLPSLNGTGNVFRLGCPAERPAGFTVGGPAVLPGLAASIAALAPGGGYLAAVAVGSSRAPVRFFAVDPESHALTARGDVSGPARVNGLLFVADGQDAVGDGCGSPSA